MIVSASRRTDLPAFYADWFVNRVRAGWCAVPNPFNPAQVARVSLRPEDVDGVVFWSRWPAPLAARLDEIESLGLTRSVFLITLLDYPRCLDPRLPPLKKRLDAFLALSERVGPERVSWRYDPVVFSNITPPDWHAETFDRLARSLRGATDRCIVSVLDVYRKIRPRLAELASQGVRVVEDAAEETALLLPQLADMARANGMSLQTCAQAQDFTALGAPPGACIDPGRLNKLFGLGLPTEPDPFQREHCRCAASRDIGMYDACAFGCAYCYATSNFAKARANRRAHDPASPSLLGRHEPGPDKDHGQARLPGT